MTIELLFFTECPHAEAARLLLRRCLEAARVGASITEKDGDHPSPSIRIDGVDVMGAPAATGRACRLDLPTEERILAALRRAEMGSR